MSKTTPTTKEQREAQRAYSKLYPTTHLSFRISKMMLAEIDAEVKQGTFPTRTAFILWSLSKNLGEN